MNCKHCQTPLDEGVTLCPNCGFDNAAQEEEQTTPAPHGGTPEQKPVNRKKLALIIAACVVVAAIAAGLVWFFCLRDRGGDAPGETQTTQETSPVQARDSYTFQGEDITPELTRVVATMDDATLTNSTLCVCYWMTYYDFLNNFGNAAASMALDTTKPLDEQPFTLDGGTKNWQQFLLEQTIASWSRYQALALDAKAAGFTLSQSAQEQLDSIEEQLASSAESAGFDSVDAMLAADFGAGITLEDYRSLMEIIMLGNEYYSSLADSLTATDEEISAYFDENQATFDSYGIAKDDTPSTINVRHILIQPEGEKAGTDESGAAVYSEEQMAEARAKAQQLLDEWKQGEATEDSFAALVADNTADSGSATTGGLYSDVTPGRMVTEFNDWCFDPARKAGDTDLVETTFGVHIMYFVSASEETYWHAAAKGYLLNQKSEDMIQACVDAHPCEVDYDAIVLTTVDTSSAY